MATLRSLEEQFDTSVKLVRALPQKGSFQPSYEDAGKVYGYYKQAKFGQCQQAKPGFWDVIGRAKWESWSRLKDMPKEEAMRHYVDCIKEMYYRFQKSEEFEEKHLDYADVIGPFCEATGEPVPSGVAIKLKKASLKSGMSDMDTSKMNGTVNGHGHEVNLYKRDMELTVVPDHSMQEIEHIQKVHDHSAIGINGQYQNNQELDSDTLSHDIIENILRSGEEAIISGIPMAVCTSQDSLAGQEAISGNFERTDTNSMTADNSDQGNTSDDEVYCDSLGELPVSFASASDLPLSSVKAAVDSDSYEKFAKAVEDLQPSETENKQMHSTPHYQAAEDLNQPYHMEQPLKERVEQSTNTDLSSLSSASGNELQGDGGNFQINGHNSVSEHELKMNGMSSDHRTPSKSQGEPLKQVEDLAFLKAGDKKSSSTRKQDSTVKRKVQYFTEAADERVLDETQVCLRKPLPPPSEGDSGIPRDAGSGHRRGITSRSHGDERGSNGSAHQRRSQQRSRSTTGYTGRVQGGASRVGGSTVGSGDGSDRNDRQSSSSESDTYGRETIGEKIVHCLEQLQMDMKIIEERLGSIEKSIKALSVRPSPWWYKYVPSKTVSCLILWPLVLNILFLYMRRRKKK